MMVNMMNLKMNRMTMTAKSSTDLVTRINSTELALPKVLTNYTLIPRTKIITTAITITTTFLQSIPQVQHQQQQ